MQARNRDERLQIMLSNDELATLDDFRFKYRLPSRAAAIRELLKRGLAAPEKGVVAADSRSKDFGVIGIANGSAFKGAPKKDGSDGSDGSPIE